MFTKSIIVPLVIFIIYLIYILFIKKKLNWPKISTIVEVIIVLILLPVYQIFLQDFIAKDEKKKEESFKQRLLDAVNEQEFKKEKYKKRITELYKQSYQSSDEDAEKWAVNFLSTINIRKDKKEQQREENRIKKQEELIKLPILYDYILHDFDSKITALREISPKTQFKKIDSFDLLVNHESIKKSLVIREVTFENGNSMKLFLNQGTINESSIQSHPSIHFSESTKNLKRRRISFYIRKSTGMGSITFGPPPLISNIEYTLSGDNFISDGLKTTISEKFKNAIEMVFMGDY